MPESLRTRLTRWGFNLFPAYFGTGARIEYIAADWREVRVAVPLSLRTRNYVGTIFGGSMYGAVDPIYMIMLMKALGPEYVVWDRAAAIRFLRPGRTTLRARFVLSEEEVASLRAALEGTRAIDRTWRVDLVDDAGTTHASVEKTIYVRRRDESGVRSVSVVADSTRPSRT
jgi:acyl-coenzyme A thioesterase PaaI-like protein